MMICNPRTVNLNLIKDLLPKTQDTYWTSVGKTESLEKGLQKAVIGIHLDGAFFYAVPVNSWLYQWHGVVWSPQVFREIRHLRKLVEDIFHLYPLLIEMTLMIPSERRGLQKLVEKIGFQKKGTFSGVYTGAESCHDGTQYSILRKA